MTRPAVATPSASTVLLTSPPHHSGVTQTLFKIGDLLTRVSIQSPGIDAENAWVQPFLNIGLGDRAGSIAVEPTARFPGIANLRARQSQ